MYWNMAMDTLISQTFLIILCYSIERIIAMRNTHDYEEMSARPILAIGLYMGSLIYSFMLIVLYNLGIPAQLAYGAQYVLFTIAAVFFVFLHIRCKKEYLRVAAFREATVAQRFDTVRNLKASELLVKVAPFKCLTNFFVLSTYYWIWEGRSLDHLPLYSTFYFYVSHLQLLSQMALTIYGHSMLRESFWALIGHKGAEKPEQVRDVLGRRMIFAGDEQAQ
ncbi:unnamed protein product, partial [Mesorhabditis spiculigera]